MSIYSGFPTRLDQEKYNGLLSKLIITLQTHLLELMGESTPAHNKVTTYSRIIAKMKDYEQHKYLPPKFTHLLTPLCKALGIPAPTQHRANPNNEMAGNYQAVKASSLSMQRQRISSHFQLQQTEESESRPKIDSMVLPKPMFSQTKKSHFQSSHELKERKINSNLPKDDTLKSADDPAQKWTTLIQTRTTKGNNISKMKTNLRYQRVLHGFKEAQQNIKRGQGREEQRRLKTSQNELS